MEDQAMMDPDAFRYREQNPEFMHQFPESCFVVPNQKPVDLFTDSFQIT
jgi:hypothetical protein